MRARTLPLQPQLLLLLHHDYDWGDQAWTRWPVVLTSPLPHAAVLGCRFITISACNTWLTDCHAFLQQHRSTVGIFVMHSYEAHAMAAAAAALLASHHAPPAAAPCCSPWRVKYTQSQLVLLAVHGTHSQAPCNNNTSLQLRELGHEAIG